MDRIGIQSGAYWLALPRNVFVGCRIVVTVRCLESRCSWTTMTLTCCICKLAFRSRGLALFVTNKSHKYPACVREGL